jgi:thymidine kinase
MPAHLHVITGPMFSGKSEALIAELNRARFARKRVAVIKPHVDTRTRGTIASRTLEAGVPAIREEYPATVIHTHEELKDFLNTETFDVLGVDEAQFFPASEHSRGLGWFTEELFEYLRRKATSDVRVIVAGLDQDFRGLPFGPIAGIMAIADRVEKLSGVCMSCGSYDARHTQRMSTSAETVAVGDIESYEVRCRECFKVPV